MSKLLDELNGDNNGWEDRKRKSKEQVVGGVEGIDNEPKALKTRKQSSIEPEI